MLLDSINFVSTSSSEYVMYSYYLHFPILFYINKKKLTRITFYHTFNTNILYFRCSDVISALLDVRKTYK